MKKNLLSIFALVGLALGASSQTLYNNSTLVGSIWNPGNNSLGNPKAAFDDVNIPSALVGAGDSIAITKVKFGIYRPSAATATTVTFYYTPYNDTATSYSNSIKVPPITLGTVNLAANTGAAVQSVVSLGDSITPLFKIKADTGKVYTGFATFYLGVKFSTGATGASWRFTTGGANDDAIWLYDADSSVKTLATYFGPPPAPKASFFTQVYGFPTLPLPISLTDFSATVVNNNALLNWKTASESNSAFFDIEASKDGSSFYSLGHVNAAGNSSTVKNYSFTDINPSAGITYYRLKLVDKDNSFKFSSIQKINISKKLLQLHVSPNPVVNVIRFNWQEEGTYQYKLTAINGKLLQAGTITKGLNELDVNKLAAGTYILNVLDMSGAKIAGQQLIKQ